MEFNTRKDDKALVFSVKGRMDATSSPEFEKEIAELITRGEKDFIIDLSELDYISSAGLRSILSTVKKLKAKEGKLFLAALKGVVKEVFEISGFSTIIPIYESVESALSEL
ncbi:MAG: STAS domain-containing protein [Deltaproteobacteria bacterium]|nr:STAS domain-containing protein [Deltaproteobacteria bacterium]